MASPYDNIIKDGKYTYDGVMSMQELDKVIEIAKNKHLVGLSVNDYLSYIIEHFDEKND